MKFVFTDPGIYHYAKQNEQAIGGSERQQWLLARALVKFGHPVAVCQLFPGGVRPDEIIEGVRFVWMPTAFLPLAWLKFGAKEKADWWYWRSAEYYFGFLVAVAHWVGSKVAFACAFDDDCTPRRALHRRAYLWPLYAWGLICTDAIIAQHDYQVELFSEDLQPKVSWVPSIEDQMEYHEFDKREKYVAWVGVLREPKRPHLLVEVARLLPQTRFVVCGPPSLHRTSYDYYANIINLLKTCPNIEYRGQVSPEEAREVISHASVFISTADKEGFPNTFLQAWGAGVPVVSLQLDPGGIIRMASLGVVVNGIKELAESIQNLLVNKAENERLGRNGFEYVSKIHNEQFVVDKFLKSGLGLQ